jgi:hypothetical protein
MLLLDVMRKLNFACQVEKRNLMMKFRLVYLLSVYCCGNGKMVCACAWIVCGWRVELMEEEFNLSINLFY